MPDSSYEDTASRFAKQAYDATESAPTLAEIAQVWATLYVGQQIARVATVLEEQTKKGGALDIGPHIGIGGSY